MNFILCHAYGNQNAEASFGRDSPARILLRELCCQSYPDELALQSGKFVKKFEIF